MMPQMKLGRRMMSSEATKIALQGPFNYINGARMKPRFSKNQLEIFSPATGKVIGTMEETDSSGVDEAVRSSKEAFNGWSTMAPRERGKFLLAASQMIRDNVDNIVDLEVTDTGKPIWESKVDISACADSIEYYGGIAATVKGSHVPLSNGSFGLLVREPIGVCGAIGAWNYPFQVVSWKAAPALAAGNTMVFKPSQFTPLTAVTLAEIFTSVGIPPGVFNVVQGAVETGEAICKHSDVAKISFTGSVPTGQKILKACADGIKKVTLELGGKSPLIVFDDCDLKNAVKGALIGNFLTQGQVCSNCTRVYVQRSIFQEFCDEMVKSARNMRIGDPWKEETEVGATINVAHAEKVLSYVTLAKEEGADILFGGERVILPEPFASAYYLSPCVIANCTDNMAIVKEEIFGAVACILPFDTEDEAIQRANSSQFGLAGGVFTKDINRGHRVASKLQAGTVWINNYNVYPPELPCGGYKMSGFGRECGEAVLHDYTQLKTIMVEANDVDCPLYKNI